MPVVALAHAAFLRQWPSEGAEIYLQTYRHDMTYSVLKVPLNPNQLEMWANAQPDGRPTKHRWRPLFNAAKFGWRPLLDAMQ